MNVYKKQKQTDRHGKQTVGDQRGEGQIKGMRETDINTIHKTEKQQGFTV